VSDSRVPDATIALAIRMRIRYLADIDAKLARCMESGSLWNGYPVSNYTRDSMIAMYEGTALELIRLAEALEKSGA